MLRVVSFPNPSLGKHAIAFQVVSSPVAYVFVMVSGWKVKLRHYCLWVKLKQCFSDKGKNFSNVFQISCLFYVVLCLRFCAAKYLFPLLAWIQL